MNGFKKKGFGKTEYESENIINFFHNFDLIKNKQILVFLKKPCQIWIKIMDSLNLMK